MDPTTNTSGLAVPGGTLSVGTSDGLVSVRLNRPNHGNAINTTMARELRVLTETLAGDDSVRAILLSGAGSAFTVGGDVNEFSAAPATDLPGMLHQMTEDYHIALERLAELNCPVVAAVRGAAAGGGLGLVYVADVVVADEKAVFTVGYGGLGLTADGGNSWFLPRLIGLRRTQEMFLLNRKLTASEALECGLITTMVSGSDVDAEAQELAERVARGPTSAFGDVRRLLRQSYETSLHDQLTAEGASIVNAANTRDASEGVKAFTERRRPQFVGR